MGFWKVSAEDLFLLLVSNHLAGTSVAGRQGGWVYGSHFEQHGDFRDGPYQQETIQQIHRSLGPDATKHIPNKNPGLSLKQNSDFAQEK